MEAIARLSASDRRELFAAVASDPKGALPRPVAVEIIEKDAWVCFALQRVFKLSQLRGTGNEPSIVFKGGTSLSKAYALIRRFSEDIDLTIDPALFGVTLAASTASKNQHRKQLEAANAGCDAFVSGPLCKALDGDISSILGESGWVTPAPGDPSTLLFAYPGPSRRSYGYVPPTVRLEFGARSEREPSVVRPIVAYAAQARPDAGLGSAFEVPVLAVERTFWEKATILHAENSRARKPGDGPAHKWARYSRHVSDLATMAAADVATAAIANEELLRRVCDCKEARFHAAYVNYGEIGLANIEVMPRGPLAVALAADYAAMRGMFFEDPPPWDEVMERISALETRIHGVTRRTT
ncbi:MAG: nucleotidyl transferase AbiEii/AbiGii toxin family protein [Planctomycetes bacterium]|nr:nucleotidyl transferase AbiEii/AbiGii toxin family protein [Planctomycetota bacterium]